MSYQGNTIIHQQVERHRKIAKALALTWNEYLDLNPKVKQLYSLIINQDNATAPE